MDPNELVVILDRAIANLPDPSVEGRRRVYERVEKTIRSTCTSEDGKLDPERYTALRRDLGTAIAMIEKRTRIAARQNIHPHTEAAPAPPPPPPPAAEEPAEPSEDAPEDATSPPWLKRIGIGAAGLAVALGALIAVLPGGPLSGLIGGGGSSSQVAAPPPPQTPQVEKPDPFAGAPEPAKPAEPAAAAPADGDLAAFAPVPSQPGVPRVTDVKVAILNGASAWRVEPLTGFDEQAARPPVMAIAQDRQSPLMVSFYCDTPELLVFRIAYGSDPATLKQEIAARGQLDGVLRQKIQVKTDRSEGFAGDFLALTEHSWGIRLAPENVDTLRAGKEIEVTIGDSVAGTVSLSGATPAIEEALASSSCT
ncbi:hypothetical protein K32_18630 [Kaistia sp. 32K]|uniref:hypothetical protein n=1 Tax=Kaistia sp. 32K TaxID=2795690 RepID=UPI0019153FC5|nr:hypothetical protein [Kaistia sp. 32K]BCP53246.1 hypothetical protein K32_18630 [Kaistia sp. 32K]